MIDVIIALLAASGTSAFLLSRWAQAGVAQSAGIFAGLPNAPGGAVCGMAFLLIASALAVLIVWKAVGLYYVYWYFRDWYSTKESVLEAVGFASTLPVSPFMQGKLRKSIVKQYFIRVVWPKREERLRREGLL